MEVAKVMVRKRLDWLEKTRSENGFCYHLEIPPFENTEMINLGISTIYPFLSCRFLTNDTYHCQQLILRETGRFVPKSGQKVF